MTDSPVRQEFIVSASGESTFSGTKLTRERRLVHHGNGNVIRHYLT